MAKELAFVLINPCSLKKSKTGGIIGRYLARTGLDFVGATMFGPSQELVDQYAALLRSSDSGDSLNDIVADYVLKEYAPNPSTGKVRRVMMLLLEGVDAVKKIKDVTGEIEIWQGDSTTIRGTYGDYICDDAANVLYFEPAVLIAQNLQQAMDVVSLWNKYLDSNSGIIDQADDLDDGEGVEKTLVMLKPDNFRFPSVRPGSIIDILSGSGLKIVGIRKFSMTVAQAEEFYGPVKDVLRDKFKAVGQGRAVSVLEQEFGFEVPPDVVGEMCDKMGSEFAEDQFSRIVQYITGYLPSECSEDEKPVAGKEVCLAIIYSGINAIATIRNILGPTDPRKANPGSVRKEYGSNIMVNAIHASDSVKNVEREMGIIGI